MLLVRVLSCRGFEIIYFLIGVLGLGLLVIESWNSHSLYEYSLARVGKVSSVGK